MYKVGDTVRFGSSSSDKIGVISSLYSFQVINGTAYYIKEYDVWISNIDIICKILIKKYICQNSFTLKFQSDPFLVLVHRGSCIFCYFIEEFFRDPELRYEACTCRIFSEGIDSSIKYIRSSTLNDLVDQGYLLKYYEGK